MSEDDTATIDPMPIANYKRCLLPGLAPWPTTTPPCSYLIRYPTGTLSPGMHVLLDNPAESGAMLTVAAAAEDSETGQIVASDEVHQVHRDYLDCFKPLDQSGRPKPIYSEHLPSTVEEAVQIVQDRCFRHPLLVTCQ